MSRLALGTAQFGMSYGIANDTGRVSQPEIRAMLKLAERNGVDTLDTAIDYGSSERCLGTAGISKFNVVTKLPMIPGDCTEVYNWVHDEVVKSLKNLRVKSIYGLLLHYPSQLKERNGDVLYRAVQSMKELGLVQKTGISIYAPKELEEIIPRFEFDLVQAPFNIIDRRLHTSGWLYKLKDKSIEIHTRSTFLQGLLLMPLTKIPEKFLLWIDLWRKWHDWLSCIDVSAVHACLTFSRQFPEIDRVIVGADCIRHLEEITRAANDSALVDLPDIRSEEEELVNPSLWHSL